MLNNIRVKVSNNIFFLSIWCIYFKHTQLPYSSRYLLKLFLNCNKYTNFEHAEIINDVFVYILASSSDSNIPILAHKGRPSTCSFFLPFFFFLSLSSILSFFLFLSISSSLPFHTYTHTHTHTHTHTNAQH